MAASILTPLLPARERAAFDAEPTRVRRALAVDPALAGRARCDHTGVVVLTGPRGGPPPQSAKERRRWELHVCLRLTTELGEAAAAATRVRWAEPRECI